MRKSEILMHPIRMRIAMTIMGKAKEGMTTFEMLEHLKDVSQATLYRHIQIMKEAGFLRITKEVKVRGSKEKYYTINEDEFKIDADEWNNTAIDKKIDFVSYYQLFLMNKYEKYLVESTGDDKSTFSMANLNLSEEKFNDFLGEINELMTKYYIISKDNDGSEIDRVIALTIIPE